MIIGFHINVSFKSMEDMRRVICMHDEKCDANKMNMHMLGFWRLHLVCVCTKVVPKPALESQEKRRKVMESYKWKKEVAEGWSRESG